MGIIVTRYMSGVEITESDLRAVKLKDPKVAEIIVRVEERMQPTYRGVEKIPIMLDPAGSGNLRRDMIE